MLLQSIPAVTTDRQCRSSQQSLQFAARTIMSGTQAPVIAAGIESMFRRPMGINAKVGKVIDLLTDPTPQSVEEAYGIRGFSQFVGAEMIAKKHGYTKKQLEAYSSFEISASPALVAERSGGVLGSVG